MQGGELFGRERETGVLDALIDRLPRTGEALLLHGEAGIGKTALLTYAAARANAAGVTVLAAVGVQSEAHLPFAGLHQLTRTLQEGVKDLPPVQRDALLGAFGMADTPVDASAPEFFLIALATLNLLADAAVGRALLLIVDDAQWLDPTSLDVLGFVARRLGAEPVSMLIALRDGHGDVLRFSAVPELRLDSLGPAAAAALLDSRVPGLPRGLRRWVLHQAAGNPLALVELPQTLSTAKTDPRCLPLTERLERAFAARAGELPSETRQLLLVAAADDAADDEGMLAEVLAATSVLTGKEVTTEALAPALEARLLITDGLQLRFRHPLVRSAVYQAVDLSERLAAHAALGQVLADRPDRQVWHRAAAASRRDETVAQALDSAAERARQRGAIAVAVTALERAGRLSEQPEHQGERLLEAAELALELGRAEVASSLVGEAAPLVQAPLEQTRVLWLRELLEEGTSGSRPFTLIIDAAKYAAEAGESTLALRLLLTAARRCWWSAPGPEIRERVAAAAESLPVPELDPDLVMTLAAASPLERGTMVIERLDKLARDGGYDAEGAWKLGTAATMVGAFDRASTFLDCAASDLRRQGRLGLLGNVLVSVAITAVSAVDWGAGLTAAAEAALLAEDQHRCTVGARIAQAYFAALRGDAAATKTALAQAEVPVLAARDNSGLGLIQIARGLGALALGQYSEAFDALIRVFTPGDPAHHPLLQTWAIGDLAEAAVRSGQREAALSELTKVEDAAKQTQAQLVRLNLDYARALLADDRQAEERFRLAMNADFTHAPLARARLLLAHGSWLRRHRRTIEARTSLHNARDAFDALGVPPWSERARQELRASGESSDDRRANTWDQLTPQELQIARLAADGLSNRKIGEQLFLSPRTISTHLYRIFPKLGISSRTQLSQRLPPAG